MSSTAVSKPSQSLGRRLLRWLTLLSIWILVPLLAAEVVLRVRHVLQEKPEDYGMTIPSENRQRRYQYNPGFTGLSHGNHHVRINSFGFRGREYSEKKGADVRRVLILGDSVAFGLYREEEYIFPSLLEANLNQSGDGWRYEVLNSAVCGYNAENELATLREMGPRVKPDLVILQTCINDIAPSNYVSAIGGGSYFNFQGDYLPEESLVRSTGEFLETHSTLAAEFAVNLDRYLKEKGKREDYFHYYHLFYGEMFLGEFEHPKVERAWEKVLETTAEMHHEADRQGARFLCLIYLPNYLMKYEDLPGGYSMRLMGLAEENGYSYINMKEAFLERCGGQKFYIDRVHLNGWGHELTARIILDHLDENSELFTAPRPGYL